MNSFLDPVGQCRSLGLYMASVDLDWPGELLGYGQHILPAWSWAVRLTETQVADPLPRSWACVTSNFKLSADPGFADLHSSEKNVSNRLSKN